MQLPHIGIDGLWICLRPAFSPFNPRGSYLLSNSFRTPTRFCDKPFQCPQQKRRTFHPPRPKDQGVGDTKEGPRLRPLTTVDRLYHELDRHASKTDFLRVYDTVGELVKQHGEAPNRSLFLALVLANTDAQHGSVTEVLRLLQEMAENEIQPDSAIFHAVLKVDGNIMGLNVETYCPR